MIQQFSYIVDCPEYDPILAINERCKKLTQYQSFLLDASAMWNHDDHRMLLVLRITGTDRWKCARYARQTAKTLLARHGMTVKGEPPVPVSVTTEQNMRGLTLEEGRTVRDYPTRQDRLQRRSALRDRLSSS